MRNLLTAPLLCALLLTVTLSAQEKAQKADPAKKAKALSQFAALEKLKKGEKMVLKGKVFYSEPLRFDYDKDGKKNNVVMASKFFAKKCADGSYDGYSAFPLRYRQEGGSDLVCQEKYALRAPFRDRHFNQPCQGARQNGGV